MRAPSINSSRRSARPWTAKRVTAVAVAAAACLTLAACNNGSSGGSGGSSSKQVGVSLILKTLSNPYFVSMEQDAKAALGIADYAYVLETGRVAMADEAASVLLAHGFRVRRLEVGFPEWHAAGLPIEIDAPAA